MDDFLTIKNIRQFIFCAGKVDPSSLTITLSDPVSVAPNNYVNFNLVGFTTTSYALVFFNGTNAVSKDYGWGVLEARLATVSPAGVVTLGDVVVLSAQTAPIYSLAVTKMSATSAVIVYCDYYRDYAISTQLLSLSGSTLCTQ